MPIARIDDKMVWQPIAGAIYLEQSLVGHISDRMFVAAFNAARSARNSRIIGSEWFPQNAPA